MLPLHPYDSASRGGRPAPLSAYSGVNLGYLPTIGSLDDDSTPHLTVDGLAWCKLRATFTNKTDSDARCWLLLVPPGATVSDEWAVIDNVLMPPNDMFADPVERVLLDGYRVYLAGDGANSLTGWMNLEYLV